MRFSRKKYTFIFLITSIFGFLICNPISLLAGSSVPSITISTPNSSYIVTSPVPVNVNIVVPYGTSNYSVIWTVKNNTTNKTTTFSEAPSGYSAPYTTTGSYQVWHDGYYYQVWHEGYYYQVWHPGYYTYETVPWCYGTVPGSTSGIIYSHPPPCEYAQNETTRTIAVWHDGYYTTEYQPGYYTTEYQPGYYTTEYYTIYNDGSYNYTKNFIMDNYGGYGQYTISATVKNSNGTYNTSTLNILVNPPDLKISNFKIIDIVKPPFKYTLPTSTFPIYIKAGYNFTFELDLTSPADYARAVIYDASNNNILGTVNMTSTDKQSWVGTFHTRPDLPDGTVLKIIINAYRSFDNKTTTYTNNGFAIIKGSAYDDLIIQKTN